MQSGINIKPRQKTLAQNLALYGQWLIEIEDRRAERIDLETIYTLDIHLIGG